jgi:hypothetical protein
MSLISATQDQGTVKSQLTPVTVAPNGLKTNKPFNPNSLANLRPFSSTVRPKHHATSNGIREQFAATLEKELQEVDPKARRRNIELIVKAAIDKAKKGSFYHFQEILDRTLGKVTQPIEVSGKIAVLQAFVGLLGDPALPNDGEIVQDAEFYVHDNEQDPDDAIADVEVATAEDVAPEDAP